MTNITFIQLGNEVLREIQMTNIHSPNYKDLRNKMKNLKFHILQHPNDKFVNDFIEVFLNLYLSLFFNEELVKAFSIQEPFYRQIQIYKNLPSTTHSDYPTFLFEILELPSFPHFYPGFQEALEKHRPELAAHPHIQQVVEFAQQNGNIIHGSIDEYKSLEEEINLYRKAYNRDYFKELQEFAWDNRFMSQDDARESFMHKKEGNIGELYAFNLINSQYYKMLVAKEAKNGFGYDIYFYDNHHVENLVEVKTTLRDIEAEDSFDLSENEYRVMQQCENNPLATYIVCRVKLDSSLNLVSIAFLTMVDSTTFVDFTSGTQYKKEEKDGPISFKKSTTKLKIYTQT